MYIDTSKLLHIMPGAALTRALTVTIRGTLPYIILIRPQSMRFCITRLRGSPVSLSLQASSTMQTHRCDTKSFFQWSKHTPHLHINSTYLAVCTLLSHSVDTKPPNRYQLYNQTCCNISQEMETSSFMPFTIMVTDVENLKLSPSGKGVVQQPYNNPSSL